jgi:hypothetical protein
MRIKLDGREMGIFGWSVIDNSRTLMGTVQSHHYSGGNGITSDYDTNLQIAPSPQFRGMATNRHGTQNPGGIIKCEIHVARSIPGTPVENDLFEPLVGRMVSTGGVFVEDLSHGLWTEIHPIDYLVADIGQVGNRADSRKWRFYAFCDDWHWCIAQPAPVPFSQTDRYCSTSIPFPDPPDSTAVPHFTASLWPESSYQSADLRIDQGGRASLSISVHTGIANHGKGLYCAELVLYWGAAPEGV